MSQTPSILFTATAAMASTPANDEICDKEAEKVAQNWDAKRYQGQHSFVYEYGSSLLEILDPKPGELILDLGCGTGELANEIYMLGASVIGIDADGQMIAQAKSQFPDCEFKVGDARSFVLEEPVDAIFSNAALHWVPDVDRSVQAIATALKPGGRFVAELGGRGNVEKISRYLDDAVGPDKNPWYFPSISEYTSILERHGMEVTYANLYDRPTPLNEGEAGLRNWILMFANSYLDGLSADDIEQILYGAESELRDKLYNGEKWIADYRRLRIVSTKL
jgi:trans-aconitate 2-methyltransferase